MPPAEVPIRRVKTSALDLAYEQHGPPEGEAIVLLHGFPYDPRCYDRMAPVLAAEGYRV
ncbi:MAG: alpha/beta hydrolase, partial [Alphaproteobacteria bacterium]|nr:alpha/beta hydrolase [Alphaproteobacteria bacterium]